jgi:hypothetical protein
MQANDIIIRNIVSVHYWMYMRSGYYETGLLKRKYQCSCGTKASEDDQDNFMVDTA